MWHNVCLDLRIWFPMKLRNFLTNWDFIWMWEILDLVSHSSRRFLSSSVGFTRWSRNSVTMNRKISYIFCIRWFFQCVIFHNSSHSCERRSKLNSENFFYSQPSTSSRYWNTETECRWWWVGEICSWARERFSSSFSHFFFHFSSLLCCRAFPLDFLALSSHWFVRLCSHRTCCAKSSWVLLVFIIASIAVYHSAVSFSRQFHTRARQFIMKVKRSWSSQNRIRRNSRKKVKISFWRELTTTADNNCEPNCVCVAE